MTRYKIGGICVAFIAFFVLNWHISNLPILKMRETGIYSEDDLFLNCLASTSGYVGITALSILYIIPVAIALFILSPNETPIHLIRYKSRKKYCDTRLKKIITIALIFAFLYMIINVIFIMANFDMEIIQKHDFPIYSLANFLMLVLFYIRVGIVFTIIKDKIRSKIFVFIAMLGVYFTEYYLQKYTYGDVWFPIIDLMQGFNILMLQASLPSLAFGYARNVLLAIMLYLLSREVFLRKDILKNEK